MPRQFDPFAVLQAIEFDQRVARRAADIVGIGRKIPQFREISDLTVETSLILSVLNSIAVYLINNQIRYSVPAPHR